MIDTKIKVLLIDDNQDDYNLTRNLLFKAGGGNYILNWEASYEGGLNAILSELYDAYLIDYRLGEHNGLELLKEVVEKGCRKPIILLSEHGDQDVDFNAMRLGAADYLSKDQLNGPILERAIRYSIDRALRLEVLQQNETHIQRLASIVRYSNDAIISNNLNGIITSWNRGAENIYGYSAQEIMGRPVSILFPSTRQDELLQIINRIKRGENIDHYETARVTKDGRQINVSLAVSPIKDEAGSITGASMISRDITEKKHLEEQLLRAKRMESLGTLAGSIAHNLNNVMAPILMSLPLLKTKLWDEQSTQILSTIESNVQRGTELIKQILSFARGVEGDRTSISIKELLDDLEKILNDSFPASIEINVDVLPVVWTISGNFTQLRQALLNLSINAREAMMNGGRLDVSARNILIDENSRFRPDIAPGPYVVISISDNGTGIHPEKLDRIFEPFFTTKEIGKGPGLGLSTTLGIVKGHSGFMDVESDLNKGSTFKIYLPAIGASEALVTKEDTSRFLVGKGELILLIDDELPVCEITSAVLEMSNYRVIIANDGAQAVALYLENRNEISLVITDMVMPVMDGPATIRALQSVNPGVKIIVVTGLMPKDTEAAASQYGVTTLLQKPYSAETLLKAVRRAVRKK
jgi:two-component system, cell cycle sensor histidine kinase and response regulator CckA